MVEAAGVMGEAMAEDEVVDLDEEEKEEVVDVDEEEEVVMRLVVLNFLNGTSLSSTSTPSSTK